jgi:hypothetical protein
MITVRPTKVEYIVIQPINPVTNDDIQDDLVDKLKDLVFRGYIILSSAGSSDGAVHYVLVKNY